MRCAPPPYHRRCRAQNRKLGLDSDIMSSQGGGGGGGGARLSMSASFGRCGGVGAGATGAVAAGGGALSTA